MSFYGDAATVASDALSSFGQVVTINRESIGTFNPATGSHTGTSSSVLSGFGAVFNYASKYIDGSNILSSDQKMLLAMSSAPLITDTVTITNGTYNIINIKTLSPAGEDVMYELQLRY